METYRFAYFSEEATMPELVRRPERFGFTELIEWMEHGFPTFLRPAGLNALQALRLEDYIEDSKYVLRAEMPGIDPAKDVEITVVDGVLSLRAERRQEHQEPHRSEFRYGAFERTVTLPGNAVKDDITATYEDGVLTLTVRLAEPKKEEVTRIAIAPPGEQTRLGSR